MYSAILLSCVVLKLSGRVNRMLTLLSSWLILIHSGLCSDNVIEDAKLDLPDLVKKYKYPFEEHFVTTEDGYILGMHRIPHGRDSNNVIGDRPVVLAMHGMVSSSADFIVMGPGSAPAYLLAEEGYDVWLGNARGNYFSRRHTTLNPDKLFNADFWRFSWDEIGNKDLPAMIDYILKYTGKSALHYIGVSQGTTVFFVMNSLRPEYNEKIISMQALAPLAYMAYSSNPVFLALAPYAKDIEALAASVGIGELLPRMLFFTWAGQTLCKDDKMIQSVCSSVLFIMGGWNKNQHNATMLPAILGHSPAGAAIRQFVHYGQSIIDKDFRRYDFGPEQNLQIYGTPIPPKYDLSRVIAPVFFHYAENDPLAHVIDVDRLFKELGNPVAKFQVPQSTFSHFDFVWGIDLKTLVYDKVINVMRLMDVNNFK